MRPAHFVHSFAACFEFLRGELSYGRLGVGLLYVVSGLQEVEVVAVVVDLRLEVPCESASVVDPVAGHALLVGASRSTHGLSERRTEDAVTVGAMQVVVALDNVSCFVGE